VRTIIEVNLLVLSSDSLSTHLVIGRDFLDQHQLTAIYYPPQIAVERFREKAELNVSFAQDLLQVAACYKPTTFRDLVQNIQIDFDLSVKKQLELLLLEINEVSVTKVKDDYQVRVNIVDPSIYAYAPRKFAYAERIQVRKITDDLLKRGIIKPSVSPYCARIVP